MTAPVFRFAPSPNGFLHLGHALSALINFELARASGGRFLLRIEDIDATRCRPEFEQAIYQDLSWLGLTWEQPVRRQSEHFDDYRRRSCDARSAGPDLSGVREPRRDRPAGRRTRRGRRRWPRDPDGAPLYPGSALAMDAAARAGVAAPPASPMRCASTWRRRSRAPGRLSWAETGAGPAGETGRVAADPAAWGDVVLARKETPTSYHLSVVVDDARQGVTARGARAGPVLVDQRAPAAADVARPAGAALSPPSAGA